MEKKSSKDATPQVFGGLAKADYAGITAWHRGSLAGTFSEASVTDAYTASEGPRSACQRRRR